MNLCLNRKSSQKKIYVECHKSNFSSSKSISEIKFGFQYFLMLHLLYFDPLEISIRFRNIYNAHVMDSNDIYIAMIFFYYREVVFLFYNICSLRCFYKL